MTASLAPDINRPRVLVLTALPVESIAVKRHLTDVREDIHRKGTVYDRGFFAADETEWEVMLSEVGAGNADAAVLAERAIEYFRPHVAMFVGIAGGIKDVARGDVVAATKVYGYESGKMGSVFQPRPEVGHSTHAIQQRARAEAKGSGWLRRMGEAVAASPRVLVGPLLAGEKVVSSSSSELALFLRQNYGDALAVEMESHGFLRAVFASNGLEALVVRGISDLLDGKAESDAEGWQLIAARNASAFAFEVLSKFKIVNALSEPTENPR